MIGEASDQRHPPIGCPASGVVRHVSLWFWLPIGLPVAEQMQKGLRASSMDGHDNQSKE